jgi:hypothetical protein
MPTVLRSGPYRFYFYSHEPNESAKFWLEPVSLAQNLGLRPKELREVQEIVEQNQQRFVEAWNDYFDIG